VLWFAKLMLFSESAKYIDGNFAGKPKKYLLFYAFIKSL